MKFGVDYKKYDFVSWEQFAALSETTVPALPAGTTLADLTTMLTGFGTGSTSLRARRLPGSFRTSTPSTGVSTSTATRGTFALGDITVAAARGNNRAVTEQDQGAYLQADFIMDSGIPCAATSACATSRREQ